MNSKRAALLYLPVAQKASVESLRKLDALAVDLGCAMRAPSCGLSVSRHSVAFADAVKRTAGWIQERSEKEMVLIIEAPLSARFFDGNPVPRHDFEYGNDLSDRRWHIGSGGAMALAAIYFLSQVHDAVEANATVHLVEGFMSRYGRPKPSHEQVALALEWVWKRHEEVEHPLRDHRLIELPESTFCLAALDANSPKCAPLVLRMPDGVSRDDLTFLLPS